MNFNYIKTSLICSSAALKACLTLFISSKDISLGTGEFSLIGIALGPIVCHAGSFLSSLVIGEAPSHGLKKLAFLPA